MNTHVSLGMKYPFSVMLSVVLDNMMENKKRDVGICLSMQSYGYSDNINIKTETWTHQWGMVKGI